MPDCPDLFGCFGEWHIYVLELANGCYYIGSCQRLGKSLGEHFGERSIGWTRDNPAVRVAELITVKPNEGSYTVIKDRLLKDYIARFGWEKVRGGQMPPKG